MGFLSEQRVTHCFLTTAVAELVLDQAWPSSWTVRYLYCGGDTLHRSVILF